MRPLYASLASVKLELGSGNAGLWYDKYCNQWRPDWTLSSDIKPAEGRGPRSGDMPPEQRDKKAKPPKLQWIETVTTTQGVGNADLLTESIMRLHGLTEARRGSFGIFTTESRFVTGLGRSHPVGNGFAWHPTLGVPYLPGSSIKGLVRAWAENEVEPRSAEQIERFFGPAEGPRAVGHVVFLDAIPIVPVRLEADVMTPHYAGWTPARPPGDWREPVPVPFLVVAERMSFFFSLLPRGIEPHELDVVFAWLREALLAAGAGAKTSVGYGRFEYDASRTEARKKEQEKQRLSRAQAARRARLEGTPEGRWLVVLEGKREQEILDLVRTHLEKSPIADAAELHAFARAVAETPYLAFWRRGEKVDPTTSGGARRLKDLARLVEKAVPEDQLKRGP